MNSKRIFAALMLPAMLILSACATSGGKVGNQAVPEPAKSVELPAYLGKWYEYGRYELSWEENCTGVTAEYSLAEPENPDSNIKVVNSCYKGSLDGEFSQYVGKAKVVPDSNNAKLKVSFFGPFYSDYWILDHGEKGSDGLYEWAIVGEPKGRYLWMLTRTPQPSLNMRSFLQNRVQQLGYDWSLVILTEQPQE